MVPDFDMLLQRAQGGDEEALDALMARHLPALREFVRVRTGPLLRRRENQSDLVQSACREALGDLSRLDCEDESAFRNWLFAVALHKILGKAEFHGAARRDADRETATPVDAAPARAGGTPSTTAIAREEIRRIERAIERLPDGYRDVIVQTRFLGKSARDVADETGRSEEAVRQLLARARARLGVLLEDGAPPQ